MIVNLTRKTTQERHNPVRRMRITRPWGQCREITVRIKQTDTIKLWK